MKMKGILRSIFFEIVEVRLPFPMRVMIVHSEQLLRCGIVLGFLKADAEETPQPVALFLFSTAAELEPEKGT